MSVVSRLANQALSAIGIGKRVTVVNHDFEYESWADIADVNIISGILRGARYGAIAPLFALYRDIILFDSHMQSEFHKRKLAVLADTFRILPYDKTLAADKTAATFIEKSVFGLSGWRIACAHLLDATLWPVAVCEKVFKPTDGGRFQLSELVAVPSYLLDWKAGHIVIRDTDSIGKVLDTWHDPDPERYIVHRGHLLGTPDNYGGPLRSLVFWWLASTQNRDWWLRFLERHGFPFLVGHYDSSSDTDRQIILAALKLSRKTYGIAISQSSTMELMEASKSSPDAFAAFQDVAQREKSKLILGQTLSSQADFTGMGSGTATLQGDVRNDIRRFDAVMLSEVLRDQLFVQTLSLAKLPGNTPTMVWGTLAPDALKAKADLLSVLAQAGLELDDSGVESISEEVGMSLRRRAPVQPVTPSLYSAHVPDASQKYATDLALLLRSFPSDVARVIRESPSQAACLTQLSSLYAARQPDQKAKLIADAMALMTAIGASTARSV